MKINKTKYTTRRIIGWQWNHFKGCRLQATINVIVGLLQVALSLIGVELIRRLTDVATGTREGSLIVLAVMFGGVIVSEMLLSAVMTWVRAVLGVRTQNSMQRSFFSTLLRGKWEGVERFHSGDVINRLFGDVNDIVSLLTEELPSLIIICVQFIASFIYLYVIDSKLALFIIITAPVFVLLSRYYFRKMRRIVRKIKDSNSALQAIIQESVQHKMVVKVMEQSDSMVKRLGRRQSVLRFQVKRRARFSIISRIVVRIGFAGSYLVALVWGLFQLQDGLITVGVLMAFTQLIGRIQRPLLDMARTLPTLVNSLTSSERLMELEELPTEEITEPVRMNGPLGVQFDDVSYRYTESGRNVVSNFSHDFKPGSFTAILGETGAGKTTLIRMMLALINPNSGTVSLYDDKNHVQAGTSTRCNFSYVPQGNTLFSGTIRENLRFGNPDATTAQMKDALRIAKADFVLELPAGLDTMCGEEGGGLSEGQAQRIAIARAVLRPCGVLLLDEATSALDVETERNLLESLKQYYKGNTTIIFITHRLAVTTFTDNELRLFKTTDND